MSSRATSRRAWGGEEFAIIFPKAPLRAALKVAEQIRSRIKAMHFLKRSTGESIGNVTVSGGMATYRTGEAPWSLIQRADLCLYAAKRHGRNRVVCDEDALAAPPPDGKRRRAAVDMPHERRRGQGISG